MKQVKRDLKLCIEDKSTYAQVQLKAFELGGTWSCQDTTVRDYGPYLFLRYFLNDDSWDMTHCFNNRNHFNSASHELITAEEFLSANWVTPNSTKEFKNISFE